MKHTKAQDAVEPRATADTESVPFMTGKDLLQSGLIGMWKKRKDIRRSAAFARRLRARASKRARP